MKLIWEKFSRLFDAETSEIKSEADLRRAIAALLIRASVIDDKIDVTEIQKRDALLRERFDLDDAELAKLVAEAQNLEGQATDLYRFTSVITGQLGPDERKDVVRMLWEIVMADGRVDEYEANLVWRVAELIGVSTRDRITLRKQVEAIMRRAQDIGGQT